MPTKKRRHKVAEQVRSVMAMHVLELGDPRFSLVTIVSVAVTNDLRLAKIYWTASGGKDRIDEVTSAFEGASSSLRRRLAEELALRFVPQLKFYYDDTLDVLEEADRLLARARTAKENL